MTNSLERELALMSLLNHSLNSSWELRDGKVMTGANERGKVSEEVGPKEPWRGVICLSHSQRT